MTHVSIVVPRGIAVMESVVSVFTILDQANEHAGATLFDVHLVGTTNRVELYGDRASVRPDLRLGATHSTDVVIVPALAGNLADGEDRNAAIIQWIQAQYRSGAEVAGLCTAALFIADAGLIGHEHCSAHWFVDAGFRNEFSHINLMVDRAAPAEGTISSTGAYSFFQRLLERVGGQALASMCSGSFETVFNQRCQSVLSISDRRISRMQPVPVQRSAPTNMAPPGLTVARFASMFEPAKGRQRDRADLEHRGGPHAATVNSTSLRRLFKRVLTQAKRGRRHEDSCVRQSGESWIMAKRKKRAMSEKEVLKHYTAYDDVPPSAPPGVDARKMLDQLRASRPAFIKAVFAVDPVLTGRKSAVMKTPATKSKARQERKHGKAKDE